MKILAISGSLRAASINSALLRAAARLAPPGVQLAIFQGVGELALFNPDLESAVPPSVAALRDAVAAADALLIASPEYAHGVSGAIKNVLDWLVGDERFGDKPVALFNASPRALHADAALRETLAVMSAAIVEAASITLPLLGGEATEEAMLASPQVAGAVRRALAVLHDAVATGNPHAGGAMR